MRLISADALLEHLFSKQDENIDIAMEIAEFPPVNQWIPCSERLPEEEDRVLVTDEDGEIEVAWYEYNAWAENPTAEWWGGEYRVFPVAWMPLPEPWKGEEE